MRAARQQAASRRTPELPPVSGARNRNPAASSSARPRKNRLGCVARNFEASPNNCGPRGLSLRARSGGGFCRGRIAIVRRLPSEPAKYADGAADAGDVRGGAATYPAVPRSKLKTKHRAHREHRGHGEENVEAEGPQLSREEVAGLDGGWRRTLTPSRTMGQTLLRTSRNSLSFK